jgi:hypothetical protein
MVEKEPIRVVNERTDAGTLYAVAAHQWIGDRELRVILSDDFDDARTAALIAWLYAFR